MVYTGLLMWKRLNRTSVGLKFSLLNGLASAMAALNRTSVGLKSALTRPPLQ